LQDKYTNLAMLAPLGMTVWHDSPHKFTKFDMSKIGTGEGAQAYGHGLYMAGRPEVANTYMRTQINNASELEQMALRAGASKDAANTIAQWYHSTKGRGGIDAALDILREKHPVPSIQNYRDKILKEEPALRKAWETFTAKGHIYKIDIPDEAVARMLDWDKPLSQQTPEVQESLKSLYKKRPYLSQTTGEHTGQSLYNAIGGNYGGITSGSDRLKAEGILGIRYLDQRSRGHTVDLMYKDKLYASNKFDTLQQAQQYAADKAAEGFATKISQSGTSNFVLFDDQLPRILEINGQPTGNVPWKPGEWDGLLRRRR
jgi:hypothetical protein